MIFKDPRHSMMFSTHNKTLKKGLLSSQPDTKGWFEKWIKVDKGLCWLLEWILSVAELPFSDSLFIPLPFSIFWVGVFLLQNLHLSETVQPLCVVFSFLSCTAFYMIFLQLMAKPLEVGEDSKLLYTISQTEPFTLVSSLHFRCNVELLTS